MGHPVVTIGPFWAMYPVIATTTPIAIRASPAMSTYRLLVRVAVWAMR